MIGWYNNTNSSITLEYEGASTTCLKIAPNPDQFPIRSGVANGVSILMDLETFDNAHWDMTVDALNIQVADPNDYALLNLNGFTVKPGTAKTVKINPILYDITETALDNFNNYDRRCVDTDSSLLKKQMLEMEVPYSLSNCLLSAALEKAYDNCTIEPQNREGLMNASGTTLYCLNGFIEQIGKWKKLKCGLSCLDSCKRQENRISTSEGKFPNKMFAFSAEFYLLIRKLYWSCQPGLARFGPKRLLLEVDYPNLCQFYDDFIYPNTDISDKLVNASYVPDEPMSAFLERFAFL